ncbi:MAG: Uma2 family endonuclease [Oscillatoriales cyanobacterium RU_3_3]|nr:Uma2 family endonuclease [Microcoleus sp. SU_5_6]NJL69076.1 Uma2 family endonuclease [Microcoleus sp. SM1_3_4]NJM63346.1 Uma2 family endonuclease [Oscillatoriales cyanobacterium RU_3_3]NJR23632.1 Uma2 family endonuclease [Richelia sp. CSU_2_1]
MNITEKPEIIAADFPDHTQLPDSDGTFVKNFQEHPQSILLTTSIRPILDRIHPDGQYCIGQDSGIYWRVARPPEPPERGAEAPDWFYVPDVPPTLDGNMRRSYVMWQELMPPLIVLEFVSGDGSEERDKTPRQGKFWIYERIIRPAFYGIYEVKKAQVEVYHLVDNRFELVAQNQRGHYQIPQIGVELGIWEGIYQGVELPWLRWWDAEGNLLLAAEELAQQERIAKEQAQLEAQQERIAKEQAQLEAEQERQRRIETEERIQVLEARLRELQGG